MDSVGRIFVAADFRPEVRMALSDRLAAVSLPGSVVDPANWHLTFRFLGETSAVSFDRLLAALDESDMPGPFPIRLHRLGAFPHALRATVLWLAVSDQADELGMLHSLVDDACEEAGVGRDDRPFRPHVTLSRLRPPVDVRGLIDRFEPVGLTARIEELVVFRSEGAPPSYTVLERFAF